MSIIKHVTLQKIVAHDFRYDPRKFQAWKMTVVMVTHFVHKFAECVSTSAVNRRLVT